MSQLCEYVSEKRDFIPSLRLDVHHVGVYRHRQAGEQRINELMVGFIYQGMVSMSRQGGEAIGEGAYLTLDAPGSVVSFEFGSSRENWVVFADSPDVRIGGRSDFVEIQWDGAWLEVPWRLPVPRALADGWQSHFMELADLLKSPTPRNRLAAHLSVMHVLAQFLHPQDAERNRPSNATSPADTLKSLIDHDTRAVRSLAQLADRCGYTPDHLRIMFTQRFGVSPIVYRQRRRMAHAMELITHGRLTIKQISREVGFPHVSHFCATFRKTQGMTPGQAMRRFRR